MFPKQIFWQIRKGRASGSGAVERMRLRSRTPRPANSLGKHWPRRGIAFVCAVAEVDPALEPQVDEGARQRPHTRRLLLTHPGIRPATALVTEEFTGHAHRFAIANEVA